jgi:hypothetical protein
MRVPHRSRLAVRRTLLVFFGGGYLVLTAPFALVPIIRNLRSNERRRPGRLTARRRRFRRWGSSHLAGSNGTATPPDHRPA